MGFAKPRAPAHFWRISWSSCDGSFLLDGTARIDQAVAADKRNLALGLVVGFFRSLRGEHVIE
jgi:hypothetical protein